ELGSELEALLLGDWKILPKAEVPLPKTGISENIARLHTERARRRLRESRLVEPGRVIGEGGWLEGRIAHQVPELVAAARAHPRIVGALPHGEWRTGLHLDDARELTIAVQPTGHRGGAL